MDGCFLFISAYAPAAGVLCVCMLRVHAACIVSIPSLSFIICSCLWCAVCAVCMQQYSFPYSSCSKILYVVHAAYITHDLLLFLELLLLLGCVVCYVLNTRI
jgi:hypothetical protein